SFWATLVLLFDRFLLMQNDSSARWFGRLRVGSRWVLSLCLSLIVGESVVHQVFSNEIRAELSRQAIDSQVAVQGQLRTAFPEVGQLENEIANLELARDQKEKEVIKWRQAYIQEAEGTAGSGLKGKGPLYQEKKGEYEAAVKDRETAQVRLD